MSRARRAIRGQTPENRLLCGLTFSVPSTASQLFGLNQRRNAVIVQHLAHYLLLRQYHAALGAALSMGVTSTHDVAGRAQPFQQPRRFGHFERCDALLQLVYARVPVAARQALIAPSGAVAMSDLLYTIM